jgi:ABC transport system ATP-binding/permease protein
VSREEGGGFEVSDARRCEHCGAPLGPRDRVCFSCQRAVAPASRGPGPGPAPTPAPAAERLQAAFSQAPQPGRSPQAFPYQDGPPGRPARAPLAEGSPAPQLQVELVWGRDRRLAAIPATGATIGSTTEADLVVPAAFLAPCHARLVPRDGAWMVESLAPGGQVLLHGGAVKRAPVAHGDVLRLADRVGNFVTVRLQADIRHTPREGALRAALPGPDQSYLIGSAASCQVRLDHPLIQARHVAVRRDSSGAVWLQDRGTPAGTYLNGHRLRGQERASVGDVLQVGPYSARLGRTALEPLEQVAGVDLRVDAARVDAPGTRNGRGRTLLDQVSLRLAPASMTAVAGPSGAGKTTLMRLLSGQLPAAAGSVTYNDVDLTQCRQAYAPLMGYVPQEDIVHGDLTADEALGYQALLRLGRGSAAAARDARIEHVLTTMGLLEQRNQLVKTLSGGQRKRVSIACELLNEPKILFLDEPTSGLDPGLDKRMMLMLRLLADQGRTVILTTHAIAQVDVCDTLILVGPGGHVIYAGPPGMALGWFGVQALGDVFSLIETPEAASQAARRVPLGNQPQPREQPGYQEQAPVVPPPAPAGRDGGLGGARPPVGSSAWRRAVTDQARIFAGRYLRLLIRDRAALAFSLLQGVAVALLTALAVPKPFSWATAGNAPMLVFGCAAVWFGMIGAVRELVKERTIWHREFLAGGDMPAYLASKVAVLGVLAAVQALSLTVVADWTLGLPTGGAPGDPLITIFITLWLAILSGMALGLLVSAASTSADRAMSLVPYLLITQLVLCGVLFRLGSVTFVSWIMPARWAVSALGGIAGLSATSLNQTSGLYPHSALGLAACWLMLLILAACGLAGTVWLLYRQGRSWSVGSDTTGRRGAARGPAAPSFQPGAARV